MTTKTPRIVGIDLGTTHTVVAASSPEGPCVFPIRQLVSEREIEARPLYASSLYAPLADERAGAPDVCGDAPWVTGEHAKRRGAEVPGRVIASAKSWLCHPGVDRLAPILPWGAEDEALPRLSPVDASTRLLAHVRRAWDEAHPDAPLLDHEVVLTVPASFDEVARELTVQAALRAGIEVRLLEEPLAAFYDHLGRTSERDLRALTERAPGGEAFVLVVDVGGGTTDLSLLAVRARDASATPEVERVAVGRHLLLGGDNMDLALAHAVEPRLVGEGKHLEPARFSQLTQACRFAKERLLGADAPAHVPIAIAGAGARLVGSTLRAELSPDDATRLVLDGFFPRVGRDERPTRARSALVSLGLPYERDVAITKHVAEFVARHVPADRSVTALLLNGGVFRAAAIRARLADVVGAWFAGDAPLVLADTDPDLAVARGAVGYGLALHGLSLRVRAGAPRAYYVGLDAGGDTTKAMCVVPRGAGEEEVHRASAAGLALVVGRPVRFDLYVADDAPTTEVAGTVIEIGDDHERVAPLVVTFDAADAKRGSDRATAIDVAIESTLTSVGTLELACVEQGGGGRFRLAFALREQDGEASPSFAPPSELPRSLVPSRAPSLVPRAGKREAEAREAIERVFGKPRDQAPPSGGGSVPPPRRDAKDLLRELERLLGERPTWTMEVTRTVFDALAPFARGRRRSADHERAFWMLAGYTLRPGVGDPGDDARVLVLAPLFAERLAFPDETRTWTQFFIAWRRIAAGLDEAAQTAIRDFLDPFLAPASAGLKKPKKPKLEPDFEMLELASSLERVPAARRAELGAWVLERTWTERDPRLWAALGRLGARVPTYGSAHQVVGATTAERWLDHLLREKWDALPAATVAAAALARRTDDRARDVSDRVRNEVLRRLEAVNAPAALVRSVREVVRFTDDDRAGFFGESLPPGLRLSVD